MKELTFTRERDLVFPQRVERCTCKWVGLNPWNECGDDPCECVDGPCPKICLRCMGEEPIGRPEDYSYYDGYDECPDNWYP